MSEPFHEIPSNTVPIAAGSGTGWVAAPIPGAPFPEPRSIRVRNRANGVEAWVGFHTAATAPVIPVAGTVTSNVQATGTPGTKGMDAGTVEVFLLEPGRAYVCAITASGTANIEFTVGEGI